MSDDRMTATDLLMTAMERFSLAEPHSTIIVWTDEKDQIQIMSNCPNHEVIGMMEYAKATCIRNILGSESER